MNRNTYRGFKVGDRVTVKQPERAYDSVGWIQPGMVGTIQAFPPKVVKRRGPGHDSGDYFAYVVFDDYSRIRGRDYRLRGGVNIINLQKVKESAMVRPNAQFIGYVQGARGMEHRLGSKKSGMQVSVNGWNSGIKVVATNKNGRDHFDVYATGGSTSRATTKHIFTAIESPTGFDIVMGA